MNGRTAAIVGSLWGLAVSGAGVAFKLSHGGPELRFEPLGEVAFAVAGVGPFVTALAGIRLPHAPQRAGVWMGTAIVALLLSFVLLVGGLGILFLPAAVALLAAAVQATADSAGRTGTVLALTLAMVVVSASAYLAPFVHRDPRCWALVRIGTEREWREIPVQQGFSLSAGPRVAESRCASDVANPTEATTTIGLWLLAGGGFVALARRARPAEVAA